LRVLVDAQLNKRITQINYSKKTFQEKWLDFIANELENSARSEFLKSNNKGFQNNVKSIYHTTTEVERSIAA
jgi:lipase chaperone LimK